VLSGATAADLERLGGDSGDEVLDVGSGAVFVPDADAPDSSASLYVLDGDAVVGFTAFSGTSSESNKANLLAVAAAALGERG
jgi:hypothetical protein